MKKLMILLTLILTVSASIVFAAPNGSLSNFSRNKTYSNNFEDVNQSSWYYENVKTAYEMGLVNGKSDVTFVPNGNITLAETITLAARVHSIYFADNYVFSTYGNWYDTYVDYAIKEEIIGINQFDDYNRLATRAEFASIMANSISLEALTKINDVSSIPDVSKEEYYSESVYMLYNAGILSGNDSYGTFYPNSNIQRSEVATIVIRIADKSFRKTLNLVSTDVAQINLSDKNVQMYIGDSHALTATIFPVIAQNKKLTWSSSNLTVASVTDGMVVANGIGKATVTCMAENGISAVCIVNVIEKPIIAQSISFTETNISIDVEDTKNLNVTYYPSNAQKQTLYWSSTNPSVASVSSTGKVTGLSAGTAYIYAKNSDGTLSATTRVTVNKVSYKVILRDKLPTEISEYSYRNELESSCTVTDFRFEVSDYTHKEEQTIKIYFSGKKTFDEKGSGQSSKCSIGWKLYDSDDCVVDSGTARSSAIAEGERFKDAYSIIFDMMPGTYYLELLDVN